MAVSDATYSLTGKVALVVGAGNGIGRAIALEYGAAGASVVCADIEENNARTVAGEVEKSGAQAVAVRLDVADLASCRASVALAVERFGGLDVLMFGAAVMDGAAKVPDIEEAVWNDVLRVNLTGAFLMSKAALPAIAKRGGGSIILIASQLARVGRPQRAAYCTTKGALVQLAKVMAIDHADEGIRVNTLSPGPIATRRLTRQWGTIEAARAGMANQQLVKRVGEPEEIARAALFLASDASSFVTGSDLLVDGGYTAV